MCDFIRNFFRYKAKSVEEFVEVMKKEGCKTALVEPYSAAKGGADTASVGVIAVFQYMLEFTATTPRGRKIVYRERSSNVSEAIVVSRMLRKGVTPQ